MTGLAHISADGSAWSWVSPDGQGLWIQFDHPDDAKVDAVRYSWVRARETHPDLGAGHVLREQGLTLWRSLRRQGYLVTPVIRRRRSAL